MSQGYLSVSLSRYEKDFSSVQCADFFNSFSMCLQSSAPLVHYLTVCILP